MQKALAGLAIHSAVGEFNYGALFFQLMHAALYLCALSPSLPPPHWKKPQKSSTQKPIQSQPYGSFNARIPAMRVTYAQTTQDNRTKQVLLLLSLEKFKANKHP